MSNPQFKDEKKLDKMEEVLKRFHYYPPQTPRVVSLHQQVRGNAKAFAMFVEDSLPECREKALALTKIEEAMMWANAAVARNGLKKD